MCPILCILCILGGHLVNPYFSYLISNNVGRLLKTVTPNDTKTIEQIFILFLYLFKTPAVQYLTESVPLWISAHPHGTPWPLDRVRSCHTRWFLLKGSWNMRVQMTRSTLMDWWWCMFDVCWLMVYVCLMISYWWMTRWCLMDVVDQLMVYVWW